MPFTITYRHKDVAPVSWAIHSIWVIPSTQIDQLEESLRRGSVNSFGDARFDAVDIKLVDQGDPQSVLRVASYSSKLIGFNAAALGVAEEFRIFPRRRSDLSAADSEYKLQLIGNLVEVLELPR